MATIDWERFNENFQYYDQETIHEVIKNFFEESEERMNTLTKHIMDQNFPQLAFHAHSLKSVIGNFMAPKPYELCRKIEEQAKQNNGETIPEMFEELKGLIVIMNSELEGYLHQ